MAPKPYDRWWEIYLATDLSLVHGEIAQLLEKAEESFFPEFSTIQAMLDRLRRTGSLPGLHGRQHSVAHGLIAAILGHPKESEEVFRRLVASSTVPGFTQNVREAAKNVGITV
jgi:hypothetical protein